MKQNDIKYIVVDDLVLLLQKITIKNAIQHNKLDIVDLVSFIVELFLLFSLFSLLSFLLLSLLLFKFSSSLFSGFEPFIILIVSKKN